MRPTVFSSFFRVICAAAVALALNVAAIHAGTIIFPQPPATWDGYCDGAFGEARRYTDASNSDGCSAFVRLFSGHLTSVNGVTQYMASPNQGYGCGDVMSVQFVNASTAGYATEFTAAITNALTGNESAEYSLDVQVTDMDPIATSTTTRTTRYHLAANQTLSVSGAGRAIQSVTFASLCTNNCSGGLGPGFSITALTATQPVYPTVDVSFSRDAAGSYSANVYYAFPAQSDPAGRSLSLSLLPDGQDPGQSWTFSGPLATGTFVQPLGMLNTDRTLVATASACAGTNTATATISGCSQCGGPPTSVGTPIRLFDGAMTYTETDPLPSTTGSEFRREYSTADTVDGRFGLGWSSLFDASVVSANSSNKVIVLINEDRTRATFELLTTGEWLQTWPRGGASGTLAGSETAGYTLRDPSGTIVRTFGANHRLVRLQDLRRGRAVSIVYDAFGNPTRMFDERGQWSCTVTTSSGHVTGIAVDGRPDLSWTYAYTGNLLTSVTVAGAASSWRSYEYVSNRMTAVRDATGTLIEGHDYDAHGRATSSIDSGGDLTNIQYLASDANGTATTLVTRADNSQAVYEQVFAGGTVVTRHVDGGCSSCGSNDATAVYDTNSNLIRLQNARGYVTQSTYDAGGRQVLQTTTAMAPSGCDPATDSAHCRLSSDALAATSLVTTLASQTTGYTYGDPNWPSRATQIARGSVIQSGGQAVETFAFDASTGETLVHTLTGAIDSAGTLESHTTTVALYGVAEAAAFDPGGAFQSAWLSLPQPAGEKKSIDGPRTETADVTTFVYYPVDDAVPGPWRGHLAAVRNALGQIARYQDYEVFGHAATVIDPNGVVTRQTFDALGRPLTSTVAAVTGCDTAADPLCATDLTTTRSYLATTGPLGSEQRPAGNVTSYAYDTRGRVQTLTRGTASTGLERIETAYDPTTGKKSSDTLRAFQSNAWVTAKTESYGYTSDGHLSTVTHADNTKQLFTYLPDGTLATVQDENHAAPNTTYAYDPAGRLASVTQTLASAGGGQVVTGYAYDTQGNLTSVTDPNGNVTTYVYDDFGQMRRQTSPVSGTTAYTYDSAGNVLTTTDANGAATTRTYDALNRVLSSASTRSGSAETVSWTYDDGTAGNFGIGRLATMSDPTGSTAYRYERRGLLRSEAKTIGGSTYTTTFTYDANGNRNAMNYPNGIAARYTFDFADRPYSLSNGAASIVSSASYLPFGPMTTLAFGNGTLRTMRYDLRYRPLENKITGPGGTIADYTYAEDANGNITQIHDAADARYNRDFGYDDLNRLTTANGGALLWGSGSYSYDAMGNMLSSSLGSWKSTASTFVGTTPKVNAVVENGASRAVTYDAAGNETAVGGSSFAYSPRNALTSADTAAYVYDGRGVLTMATLSMLSLNVAPSSVTGGNIATGTVTLSAPAAADTTVVLASSNTAAATVPATVVVAAGATGASFPVTTSPSTAATTATITSTLNQYSAAATISILPADLASLTLSPSTIVGGSPATGTLTLTGPAATSLTVALSSNNSAASVPPSVTIAAGASSATFTVTTTAGVTSTTAVISATLNATTRQATLTFADAELSSVAVTPASIINGMAATGAVTLTGPANAPVVVGLSLSSNDAVIRAPNTTSITVTAGASSATFMIYGNLHTLTPSTVTITASHAAVTRQAMLTVNLPWLNNFTVSPQSLIGGNNSTGSVTLNGQPPTNAGYNVTFTSTNASLVATPKTISNMGTTSAQSTVFTNPVLAQTPVVVTAHDPTGVNVSQTMTLLPAPVTISALTLNPTSIIGSNGVTGTVTLTAAAPSPGIDLDLRPLLGTATAYSGTYVRVPAGSTSATFPITTQPVRATSAVTISAIHSATTKTATLTLQAPSTTTYASSLWFPNEPSSSQAIRNGAGTITATVALQTAAGGGGVTVNLSSSNTAAATVPASVKVAKGTNLANFTITTFNVASPADVVITATSGGSKATAKVIVVPAGGAIIASVTLFNHQYASGSVCCQVSGIGNVNLTGPAPAGGITVTIGGSRPNIITLVDVTNTPVTTITVPAGATSALIYAWIYPFTGTDHATTITATASGITRSDDVLLTAIPQARLKQPEPVQCASLHVAPCLSALATFPPATLAAGDTAGYDLYTPELRLLAETEVSAAAQKQIAYSYLWFGDLPVAQVQTGTNTTRWYATDHLGTPLLMTDTSGTVVWHAEYAPYGTTFTTRAGAALHQPLRFPGQVAMDGADTYYNVFRHYRSGWGRYTQTDPVGVNAGVNLYSYVGGSPAVFKDPLGLVTVSITPPAYHYEDEGSVNIQCGSSGAHGCTVPVLRIDCGCSQCGTGYKPHVSLTVPSFDVYISTNAIDFNSINGKAWQVPIWRLRQHEQLHVAGFIKLLNDARFRGEIYESITYPMKSGCETACVFYKLGVAAEWWSRIQAEDLADWRHFLGI